MTDEDKKMVVMHVVEKVFIPDVLIVLHGFIAQLKHQIIYQHEYKQAFGFQIAQPVIPLDLRDAQEHLAESIAVALADYPPKNAVPEVKVEIKTQVGEQKQ